MSKFMGYSVDAIQQWNQVASGETLDMIKHIDAVKEGLIATINGKVAAAPGVSPVVFTTCVADLLANVVALEEPTLVVREFGEKPEVSSEHSQRESETEEESLEAAEVVEDPLPVEAPALDAKSDPVAETSSPEPQEEPASSPEPSRFAMSEEEKAEWDEEAARQNIPKKLDDDLRAKVAALPSYYAPLKEPLNKLIDSGCDNLVIDTALELAGKPYHLGQIASYAKAITASIGPNRDLMQIVQNAHRVASKVENLSESNEKILTKIMALIPENRKAAWKLRFEQEIKDGKDKYWAEAWGQVEAAVEAGRTKTPVNLFTHILKDMERNADLSDLRGAAKITSLSEIRWIMEYLPKPEIDFTGTNLERCGRKYYLPKLKAEIERVGYIPLPWIMAIMLDNDYPVRSLTGLAEILIERNPALARVVTREQFEYAMTLLAKTFIDRAARCRESWDPKWERNHLGASLFHNAVFMGHKYVHTLKNYSDAKQRFMDSLKSELNELLADTETLELLRYWHLDQNPWRHGDTPEKAREHREEADAFQARQDAVEAARRATVPPPPPI